MKKTTLTITGAWVLAVALALPLGAWADEGYDPMLQISNQFAKPNVLIVLDVTGSMAYEQNSGTNVGVDTFGLPDMTWTSSVTPAVPGRPTATQGASCGTDSRGRTLYYWTCSVPDMTYTVTYTLRPTYNDASRLDVFKNALGNSVPLYSGNTVVWPSTWPVTYTGWTYAGGGQWTKTVTVPGYSTTVCQRTAPSCASPGSPTTGGAPFTPSWTVPDYSTSPVTKATMEGAEIIQPSRLPQNLVGLNKNNVNWGLMTFSTSGIALRQAVIPDDSSTVQDGVATKIQAYLKPSSVSTTVGGTTINGLGAGGTTCTSQALNMAKRYLAATYNSGGPGGTTDPKSTCGRLYANILVTDGQSNYCNDSGCGSSTYWGCDTSYTNWATFPAGRSNENFVETSDGSTACTNCRTTDTTPVPVRTFVIGVSNEVARCELNLVAYFGRTDASSPNGDAGMRIDKDFTVVSGVNDYRLPVNVPSNFKAMSQAYMGMTSLPAPLAVGTTTATTNYTSVASSCTTNCQDYAFFATNPTAVYDAFATILGAIAAGDYTTSAPVASSAMGAGTIALLASSEYPLWKGHLYAFDTTKTVGQTGYLMWDAGYNLTKSTGTAENPSGTSANPGYVAPSSRRIYTWNPSSGNAIVQIATDATTVSTLNTICGSCGYTAETANFTLGYDGTSSASTTIRPWVMGSTINATPAITQNPEQFLQGTLPDHKSFETNHTGRTPLVWLGADDGMLHAFQLSDGSEYLAVIPPNLLAKQVQLKAAYDASKAPTGQPKLPQDHIYGLASSPRYGDMWFPSGSSGSYKTVMLLTEGPGGNLMAGLDVTDPTQSGTPISVLWSKTGTDTGWTGMFGTWSVPASGAISNPNWRGIVGGGFNPSSTASSQVTPKAFIFNPIDGSVSPSNGISPSSGTVTSPAPWVGNQCFADSVMFQTNAEAYYADNIVNLALQPDLNGRIWFIPGAGFSAASIGIDATNKAGQQQPIYYSPAVNGYKVGSLTYDLYAFASGTPYEKSSNVSGSNVGSTGYFSPSLYLVTKGANATAATATEILRLTINSLYVPETDTSGNLCTGTDAELVGPALQVLCVGRTHVHLGRRTQVTAPPALFVPVSGASGDPVALFLLYDPDASCAGQAYILQMNFNVGSGGAPSVTKSMVYGAGEGAASGFAVAGTSVIVAKSAVGQGKQAGVTKVPGLNPTAGMSNPTPIWWRELK